MMNNVEKIKIFEVGFTLEVPEKDADPSKLVNRTFYTFIKAETGDEALEKFRFLYCSLPGQYQEKIVNSQEAYDVVLPGWRIYLEHDLKALKESKIDLNDPMYMHDEFAISLCGGIEGLDY